MNKATISADIVSSTSLDVAQRLRLEKELKRLLNLLKQTFGTKVFYGRMMKGDYIECVLENPKLALRVALLLKSYVKSLDFEEIKSKKFKDFKDYGIRVAVGVGELSIWNKRKGIIDGEAIHLSGRAINEMTTPDKQIRKTLVFKSKNEDWNQSFAPIFNLLDILFLKYKKAQSEVIFHKLLNHSEKEITTILNKSQSTINQHSKATGWSAVDSAVAYFEQTIN